MITTGEKIKWLRKRNFSVREDGRDFVIEDLVDPEGFYVRGPLNEIVDEAYDLLTAGLDKI